MRASDTALLMSFAAWLLARYRLDVTATAAEFLESTETKSTAEVADFAGLPVELIGKMQRDGNPAEFLSMQDIADLKSFIKGQRDVISAQQRRIAQLIEDDGVRRNGTRIERENLQHYVDGVERHRDNLQIMVDAGLRNVGLMRRFALQHGYNQAGEMNDQEFIFSEFERLKILSGSRCTGQALAGTEVAFYAPPGSE